MRLKFITQKLLLTFGVLFFLTNNAFAQCVTSGAITASCTLNGATSGNLTIGNVTNGVTVTLMSASVAIDHTVNDDDGSADGELLLNSISTIIYQNAAIGDFNPLNRINIVSGDWIAYADITVNTLNLSDGTIFTQNGNANVFADIIGSSGAQTYTSNSTGALGQAGNTISLNDGNDSINLNRATTIAADSIDGGAGTDAIVINGGDVILNSDVTSVENINITTGNQLTIGASVTDATINMSANAATLVINAAGESISGTIEARDGFLDTQVVTLTNGNLSSNINLRDGDDVLNLNGGTFTGNVDLGSENDTLNIGVNTNGTLDGGLGTDIAYITAASLAVSGSVSGFETIDLSGNTLTINKGITGLSTSDNTGFDLDSGTLNINDGGSITGAIHSAGGTGTGSIIFGADTTGGTFNIDGIIEDTNLTVTSGTVNTNGHVLGANSPLGDITIGAAATLNLTSNITSGGTYTNNGTTQLNAGTTLTANDYAAAAGTLIFGVDSSSGAGKIIVSAGDVDLTGATITANIASGTRLSNGAEFLIADGTTQANGGTGQAASIITDNSFIWKFTLADGAQAEVKTGGADNTEIYLVASLATTINDLSENRNNANVGDVILDLSGTTDSQLQQIYDNFNTATSKQAANNIFASALPTIDGGHVVGAVNTANQSLDITHTRLNALRMGQTGISTGDDTYNAHLWAQAFGQAATQDRRDDVSGYDANTYGFALGTDYDITDELTLGLSFSYANTDIDSNNLNRTHIDIDSYQGTIYGGFDVTDAAYINAMLGYMYGSNDATRHDIGAISGLTAHADFDSHQISARIESGTDIHTGNNLIITPNALVNYMHYAADDYTETGAGGANLHVNNESQDILEFGIGIDVATQLRLKDKPVIIEPLIRAGYRYDVVGDAVETTSRFIGGSSTFKSEGFDPAQSRFNAGARLNIYSADLWSFSVAYDYEAKQNYDAHSGTLKIKKAF